MKKSFILISTLALLFIGCQHNPFHRYTYHPPENMNDGLDVGSLDEVDMDSAVMKKAVHKIHRSKFKEVHAILVYKDGKNGAEQGTDSYWDEGPHILLNSVRMIMNGNKSLSLIVFVSLPALQF